MQNEIYLPIKKFYLKICMQIHDEKETFLIVTKNYDYMCPWKNLSGKQKKMKYTPLRKPYLKSGSLIHLVNYDKGTFLIATTNFELPYRCYLSPGVLFFKMGFWVGFNSNLAPIWPILDLNIGFWLGLY